MAGAAICAHSGRGAAVPQVKVGSFRGEGRSQRSNCTCGSSSGDKASRIVMRSSWLGEEERRWRLESGRNHRRGHSKGLVGAQQLQVRAGLDELLHNKVLISSTAAGALGQLAKPFFLALRGKGFNWRLIYTSGGMPSTHSACVTACATVLGLERGLGDSVFGFAIILASVVMYDAQGVRRSVGKQAEVLNTMVFTHMAGSVAPKSALPATSTPNPSPYAIGVELARDPVQAELAFMEDADASTYESSKSTAVLSKEITVGVNGIPSLPMRLTEEETEPNGAQIRVEDAENLPSVKDGEVTLQEIGSSDGWRHIPLKQSVGHTKVEVFVGAIWGIAVALTLHSSLQ